MEGVFAPAKSAVFTVAVAAVLFSVSAFAADAQGWYEEDCDGVTFHLTKFDESHASSELTIRVMARRIPVEMLETEKGWLDGTGKVCSTPDKCEDADHAKLQLKTGSKRVSGNYSADLGGRHFEGQFQARRQKIPHLICE